MPEIPVMRPQGRIDATTSDRFLEEARAALDHCPNLTVSFKAVNFLDSTALSTLVVLANQARLAGGALSLVEVPNSLTDLLSLVRLLHLFEVPPEPKGAERQHDTPAVTPTLIITPNGWAIIKAPRIFDAKTAPLLLERCTEHIGAPPRLVVDLTETIFLASAGMAALIKLDRKAKEQGGALRVACCSSDVRRTLKLVRLDTILAIYATVEEAVAMPPDERSVTPN